MTFRGFMVPVGIAIAASLAVGAYAASDNRMRLERLNVQETSLSAEQGRNLNRMSRLLTALAQFRRDPPPALLVSPADATEAVRAAILVKAITPELQKRARVYAAQAEEIARRRRLAAVASEALFTNDSALADQREREEAIPPGAAPLVGAPITPPAALLAPVEGEITRRFGEAAGEGAEVSGMTYAAAKGARVAAPGDGLVQYVGPVKGWGVILILRLAGGYHLVLAGLDRSAVETGQSVAAGAPVGWMSEGRESPSELYLEVRERGAPVDPARWLAKQDQ
jgi:septal ring factor EnvC (AmiA/AmiB activator)